TLLYRSHRYLHSFPTRRSSDLGSAVKIFDIKAGRRNYNDLSAFGNKLAIKLSVVEDITMKLTAAVSTGATTAYLDSVDNLQVGRSEEHTSELQSRENLVCRLLL